MLKAIKLVCIGVLPLLVGLLLNRYIMMDLPLSGLMMQVIGIALLAAWAYLAFKVSDPGRDPVMQAFLLSAFGLVMLALALYQELVAGQYWPGRVGFGTQMYFLPFLSLASSIVNRFFSRIWPDYIVVWLGIFLAGWAGCRAKQGR